MPKLNSANAKAAAPAEKKPTPRPRRKRDDPAHVSEGLAEAVNILRPEEGTVTLFGDEEQEANPQPVDEPVEEETPAKKAVSKAAASRAQRKAAQEEAEKAPEEPEAVDTPPEAEDAKETPEEPKEGKPKPPRRRAVVSPTAQATQVQAFKPDFSKLAPLAEKADYLRAVLYGDHGVGKSTSMATLANRGLIAVIDPENSVRKGALKRQGINTDNILLWPDWTFDGVQQFYLTVRQKLEEEPGSVFAVGIDTVTALSQFWLEQEVEKALVRPSMRKKHPERTKWDVFQDDYGVLTEQIRSLITRQLYTLPCHVVITAHARRAENEDGKMRVGPALSPAAQSALLTYSDWVFRMYRTEAGGSQSRLLDTAPRGQVEAKDRFGLLDPVLADWSMLDLVEEWEANQ